MSSSKRQLERLATRALREALRGGRGGTSNWSLLLSCASAAVVGWLARDVYDRQRRAPGNSLPPVPGADAGPDVVRICAGAPPSWTHRRASTAFVTEYDAVTRNPRWVVEYLSRDRLDGAAQRAGMTFREDAALPSAYRAKLSDYADSGYDRGHLAPAADHRASDADMADTFYLTNISPQVGVGFNRDYWSRVEKMVRDMTKAFAHVHVVTGPAFLPTWTAEPQPAPASPRSPSRKTDAAQGSSESSGGGGGSSARAGDSGAPRGRWQYTHTALGRAFEWLQVPTHFYKVVFATDKSGKVRAVCAFLLPNAPIAASKPVTDFLVPVSLLESATGLSFFQSRLSGDDKAAVDAPLATNVSLAMYQSPAAQRALSPAASPWRGGAMVAAPAPAGVYHVCSLLPCALPADNWFEVTHNGGEEGSRASAAGGGSSSSSNSSGGGGSAGASSPRSSSDRSSSDRSSSANASRGSGAAAARTAAPTAPAADGGSLEAVVAQLSVELAKSA